MLIINSNYYTVVPLENKILSFINMCMLRGSHLWKSLPTNLYKVHYQKRKRNVTYLNSSYMTILIFEIAHLTSVM